MAKLKLSKRSLQQERQQLALFVRLLPSLDLKRLQLMAETRRAHKEREQLRTAIEKVEGRIGRELPMLADVQTDLSGLVRLSGVTKVQQNVVGVVLPLFERCACAVADYSLLAVPPWVDALVDRVKEAVELRVREETAAERVRILEHALKRITQRVNLFEKVLIPCARKNIRRIQIYLGDAERAAVVTSKIAKKKQIEQRSLMLFAGRSG
jgi:V/A-type H+-transporting ATPase subunit D